MAKRWNSCNVLRSGAQGDRLWHYQNATAGPKLAAESVADAEGELPKGTISKSWQNLWQQKLNVAWLPADRVCLRVLDLPVGDPLELRSMVELQIERLSPLPVAQIVWGIEVVPPAKGAEVQSVIVLIADLDAVDNCLDDLEHKGFYADKLDLPVIRQLLAIEKLVDGVWVIPASDAVAGKCLIAWRSGGSFQSLSLVDLEAGEAAPDSLRGFLAQMSWAGEIEGWLADPLPLFLVSNEDSVAGWRKALMEQWQGGVEIVQTLDEPALAEESARQAKLDLLANNVMPADTAVRYRQQFVDGLWMRGLGAIIVLYLLLVAGYFGLVQWQTMQLDGLKAETVPLKQEQEQVLALEKRAALLQDQAALKYAGLDCLLAVSEKLPPDLTLSTLSFSRGRVLTLRGQAPIDKPEEVSNFNDDLAGYTIDVELADDAGTGESLTVEQKLFSEVNQPNSSIRKGKTGQYLEWNFASQLLREETDEEEGE